MDDALLSLLGAGLIIFMYGWYETRRQNDKEKEDRQRKVHR